MPLFQGTGGTEGQKPKQLQGTSTDMEWPVIASLLITLEVGDEYSSV